MTNERKKEQKDLNSYDSAISIETKKALYWVNQCSQVLKTSGCIICPILQTYSVRDTNIISLKHLITDSKEVFI